MMNRRTLFAMLGATFVVPFVPKPKAKFDKFTDFGPFAWRQSISAYSWTEIEMWNQDSDKWQTFEGRAVVPMYYKGVPIQYRPKLS